VEYTPSEKLDYEWRHVVKFVVCAGVYCPFCGRAGVFSGFDTFTQFPVNICNCCGEKWTYNKGKVVALAKGIKKDRSVEGKIICNGFIRLDVCVAEEWSEDCIVAFAERECASGTKKGWSIYRWEDGGEVKSSIRCECEYPRVGFVHMRLDA